MSQKLLLVSASIFAMPKIKMTSDVADLVRTPWSTSCPSFILSSVNAERRYELRSLCFWNQRTRNWSEWRCIENKDLNTFLKHTSKRKYLWASTAARQIQKYETWAWMRTHQSLISIARSTSRPSFAHHFITTCWWVVGDYKFSWLKLPMSPKSASSS